MFASYSLQKKALTYICVFVGFAGYRIVVFAIEMDGIRYKHYIVNWGSTRLRIS